MNSTLLAEIDKIKNLEPNWNSYQDNHVSDVAAFIAKELVERLDLDDTCFCPLKDGGMWLLVLNGKNDIEVYEGYGNYTLRGNRGSEGYKGITGKYGETGLFGSLGYQGLTGLIGCTGMVSSEVQGVTGLKGAEGSVIPAFLLDRG